MITAQADKALSRIMIICDDSELDQLIRMIDEDLCVLRRSQYGEDTIILEVLEDLRYKMRCVININREDNSPYTVVSSQQKKNSVKNSIALPIVEAFYYARILQRIAEPNATQENHADQNEVSVGQLVAAIDDELKQVIRDSEYRELIRGRQENITFLYIQYLNHLYESRSPEMENEKRIRLLLELYKLIVMSENEAIARNSHFSFCPYSVFKRYCDDLMKKNNMKDICLDELLAEEAFRRDVWDADAENR